jgi:hypothetical protein
MEPAANTPRRGAKAGRRIKASSALYPESCILYRAANAALGLSAGTACL